MKFARSIAAAAFGLASITTLFSGVAGKAAGNEIDVASIVKVLEARDVPADIIKAVNVKLMARNEPAATVTVTLCPAPNIPATSGPPPPFSTPIESSPASNPPATPNTTAGGPPPETPATSGPVETPTTPPATSAGPPPASSTPPATEATPPASAPSSSVGTEVPPTTTIPGTSTGTLTQTSTEFSTTETSVVESSTTLPATSTSSIPPAPNAAGIAKMDVVAIGVAALAALY